MAVWSEAAAVLWSSPVCALPQYLVIDRLLLRVAIHRVTLENPEQRCMYQIRCHKVAHKSLEIFDGSGRHMQRFTVYLVGSHTHTLMTRPCSHLQKTERHQKLVHTYRTTGSPTCQPARLPPSLYLDTGLSHAFSASVSHSTSWAYRGGPAYCTPPALPQYCFHCRPPPPQRPGPRCPRG